MDFFFKWLLVLTIVALRLLSFAFAVRDAYQANRQSRHHSRMLYQTPKTSVWLLIAKIILGNDYDWWTVKPRPVEITTIPWYRRMIRPFFDQPNQDGTTDSVKTFPAIIFGEHTFRARRWVSCCSIWHITLLTVLIRQRGRKVVHNHQGFHCRGPCYWNCLLWPWHARYWADSRATCLSCTVATSNWLAWT